MSSTKKSKKAKPKGGKQTLSLAEFIGPTTTPGNGTAAEVVVPQKVNWADESEEVSDVQEKFLLPIAPRQSLGPAVNPNRIPNAPPFIAHVANLPFEVEDEDISKFFTGLKIESIRLPTEGGEFGRFKGFGYVEFASKQDLIDALDKDDDLLMSRKIRVDLADEDRSSRRGGEGGGFSRRDEEREDRSGGVDDWRAAPRETKEGGGGGGGGGSGRDSNDRFSDRRGGYGDRDRGGFGDRDRGFGDRSDRDRGFGDRSDRDRGFGDRGDRDRGFGDRGDRDRGYGNRDRYDDKGGRYGSSRYGGGGGSERGGGEDSSKERPKLNLKPRSKPSEEEAESGKTGESSSSIFGGARPVDTAQREQELERKKFVPSKFRDDKKEEAEEHDDDVNGSGPSVPAESIFGSAKPVDTAQRELEIEKRLQEKREAQEKIKDEGGDDRRGFRDRDHDRDRGGRDRDHDRDRGGYRRDRDNRYEDDSRSGGQHSGSGGYSRSSDAPPAATPVPSETIFGAAKPVDTAQRELEIERRLMQDREVQMERRSEGRVRDDAASYDRRDDSGASRDASETRPDSDAAVPTMSARREREAPPLAPVSNKDVFGNARPVDTAAREREIEKKLLRRGPAEGTRQSDECSSDYASEEEVNGGDKPHHERKEANGGRSYSAEEYRNGRDEGRRGDNARNYDSDAKYKASGGNYGRDNRYGSDYNETQRKDYRNDYSDQRNNRDGYSARGSRNDYREPRREDEPRTYRDERDHAADGVRESREGGQRDYHDSRPVRDERDHRGIRGGRRPDVGRREERDYPAGSAGGEGWLEEVPANKPEEKDDKKQRPAKKSKPKKSPKEDANVFQDQNKFSMLLKEEEEA